MDQLQQVKSAEPREFEDVPCIRIDCPDWYKRADFCRWLNGETPSQLVQDGGRLATWHKKGEEPNEYGDVFMTFDYGEGSDSVGVPDDIWEVISKTCEKAGADYAVIWLVNV